MSPNSAPTSFPPVPDRYAVIAQVGRGASGTVFKARDRVIGRFVALKRLDLSQAADEEERETLRQRFVREAQTAGRLAHRNVVTVYDVIKDAPDGATLLVMEWVEGESLKRRLNREKPLAPELVVDIASQIAEGLDYAHRSGVVHRDVKPANVLMSRDGRVMIADFGIARLGGSQLTLEGEVLGTPAYMAPEQILGKGVTASADIFALGAICYEMITAHPPFSGEQLVTVLHRIVHEEPEPPASWIPDLPARVGEVLLRSLSKDPAARPESAGELARDLAEAYKLADRRSRLLDTGDTYRLRSDSAELAAARTRQNHFPRSLLPTFPRKRLGILLIALAAILILAIGGSTWWLRHRAFQPAPSSAEATTHRRQLEYLLIVSEGRRMLESGDPAAAQRLFQEAAKYAPPRNSLEALEQRATEQLHQKEAKGKLEAAERAVSEGDYRAALSRVEQVMGRQGNDVQVKRLLAQIESGIKTPPPPSHEGPAVASNKWAVVDLQVAIFVPRGVCTIYAGSRQILRRAVDFSDNLAEANGERGRFTSRLSLPAGSTQLRIYWSMRDRPTRLQSLQVRLTADSERHLRVTIDASGALEAALDKR